ncbi:response regulator transcription factor [Acidipila sp. EB88]|uniref:response regulator n=1 Tax=Acidipila sp. EB88 TaxID=2305226 RepID=UPI000FA83081|nr:response regulator transcription factor [Acidipila sp. EB88]RRA47763.1 DNA-binding response regulator [Acidipila sp. EB88]
MDAGHWAAPEDRADGAPIRLLLLDDHGLFREGLSRLLAEEPDLTVAVQCASAGEALAALVAGAAPDLVLLDFDLGEHTGFAFLEGARALGFRGRVLMVTAGMSPGTMARALEAGVSGLFLKHAPPVELIEAIRRVMRGEPLISAIERGQVLAAARLAEHREQAGRTPQLQLSEREQAVLRGVFAGLANKEIATQLGISEGSVKAVLQQLFSKTGVRTRAQLVRIALEHHFDTGTDARPNGGDGGGG